MPASDLIDRYLAAIRRNLPSKRADDIVAELREALLSEQEDKESRLGRPLAPDEQEALVKDFGHPLVVAARYGASQQLIGPEVYPFYLFTLKTVLLILGAVILAGSIAGMVFAHGPAAPLLGRTLGALWSGLFWVTGLVTIIFAVMERTGAGDSLVRRWRPRDLPRVTEKPATSFERIAELTWGVIFLLFWVGLLRLPEWSDAAGRQVHVRGAPVWTGLYWPVIALVVGRMVIGVVALLQPGWVRLRTGLTFAVTLGNLALVAMVWRAQHWVVVSGEGLTPAELGGLQVAIELGIRIALVVVGLVAIIQALVEAWRLRTASRRA